MKKIFSIFFSVCILLSNACLANDLYDADVSVDVTAKDSSSARDMAMNEANRKALLSVAQKITTEEGVAKFASLTDDQILNFIQETSVISEKASDVRYIASLKISINEGLIKAYIEEQGIPLAIDETVNTIIIPVYHETSGSYAKLWEPGNPWADVWDNKVIKKWNVNFRSAPKSAAEYLTANQAISLDGVALSKLAIETGVRDIYVLEAVNIGANNLEVSIFSYKDGGLGSIRATGYDEAVSKTTEKISENIKKQNIKQSSYKSEFTILYNYSSLKDWVDVEKKLRGTSYIDELNVDAIGGGKVQFKIVFTGSRENLFRSLGSDSIYLEDHGSFYLLKHGE